MFLFQKYFYNTLAVCYSFAGFKGNTKQYSGYSVFSSFYLKKHVNIDFKGHIHEYNPLSYFARRCGEGEKI